jgi:hypothetical protein
MCEPATISTILLVSGMAVTAYAGNEQAKAEREAGNYQAEVAEVNAKQADYRAEQAGRIGAVKEEQHRAEVRRMAGNQRATLAANGVDVGSGTALALVDETYTLGEADALTIRYNAMNEAWGHRQTAVEFRQQGQFANYRGKTAAQGTYLTTAANLSGQYAQYLQQGKK